MNYDRVKNIFIELYDELCETFDTFESDFKEAIGHEYSEQTATIPNEQDQEIAAKLEYFEKITESNATVEKFIKESLAPLANARSRFDISNSYHQVIARETATSVIKVSRDPAVNYTAFKRRLAMKFNIYRKDIYDLVKASANK